jgi:hypothetical protein
MRFKPPHTRLPDELTWLLAAAFGPDLPPSPVDLGKTCELAGQFDLGARVVARHHAADLESRLGAVAGELTRAHRRAAAVAMLAERTAKRLTELTARSGLAVIGLKGYALHLSVPASNGRRPFVDLDVLLSREGAAELRKLLVADGWMPAPEADNPQHLPPITAPEGTPVDIHFRLRGVKVAGARWASAEELLASGLCRPAPGMAEGVWIPNQPVMAAHIAVHALEQHGHRPTTYPLLRAVADLADLAAMGDETLGIQAGRLTGESLAEEELRALFTLGGVLAEGRLPAAERDEERPAEILLRHIVAGTLDPLYREGLALDHTAGRLRQARRDGVLMRYIAGKLKAPGDLPVAGSSESARGLGSASRRLLHPIHLGARFFSAAAARLQRALDR